MICPLRFTNSGKPLCDKEKCGFYSCKSQKCAIASLSDIACEIAEHRPPQKISDAQREWIEQHSYKTK